MSHLWVPAHPRGMEVALMCGTCTQGLMSDKKTKGRLTLSMSPKNGRLEEEDEDETRDEKVPKTLCVT